MKVIYILGDGRSGSTLLDAVLSNTENSISIGEGYRFWRRFYEADTLCSCNEPIDACVLWSGVHAELQKEIPNYNPADTWDRIQFLLKFKNVKRISEIIKGEDWQHFNATVKHFYNSIVEISAKNIIIDSSKSVGWLYLLHALNIQELKVIHLERNLQAVANSWKKQITLPEYFDKEVFMPTRSTMRSLKTWLKVKFLAKSIKKKTDSIFLTYENFIKNPERTFITIETFASVSLPTNHLKYMVGHSIGGNPMRSKGSGTITIQKNKEKFTNLNLIERYILTVINWLSKQIL